MLAKKPEYIRVGNTLTYGELGNVILGSNLQEGDTIILNPNYFDEVILSFRDTYSVSMLFPHILFGVYIEEQDGIQIPRNMLGVVRVSDEIIVEHSDSTFSSTVYKCAWCGNLINQYGKVLSGRKRRDAIDYIMKEPNPSIESKNGDCCIRK